MKSPDEDPLLSEFKIINGLFAIQPNGTVDLGPEYGSVMIEGLQFAEAQEVIKKHLIEGVALKDPKVAISLVDVAGKQTISGEHLVRPDGTVSLGIYGSIWVTGMTIEEVEQAIEQHLSQFIHKPEIRVDVLAYNSKVYYIITDGGGFGEQVIRLPSTGNETVLDAVAAIEGLSDVSSKKIWVARPAPAGMNCAQTMTVDWRAITPQGITTTNYQVLPGDRIYIKADHLITFDNLVAKVVSPIERVMGVILLGDATFDLLQSGVSSVFGGSGGF